MQYSQITDNGVKKPAVLKVKKLVEKAKTPTKATEHAAGYDLYSIEDKTISPGDKEVILTGIAV